MSHKNNESIWVKESKNIFNFVFLLICISLIIEIYVEYIETGLSINCFHDIYNLTVVSISFILFRCKLIKASVSYSIIHYTVITSIMTSVYYKVNLPDFNFEIFFLKSQILIMSLTIAIAFLIKPTHIWYSNILNFIFILCNYIFLGELYTLSKFVFYFVIVLGTGIGCYLIQSNFYKLRKQVKNTNKKLTEQNKELNKSNIAKDQMFKIIGHDLRTPFTNIIGLTGLLIDNSIDYEESEKYIKILNSSAKNTLILLDNLLNWAKSQTGQLIFKPEKIIISNVIQEIIALNKLHADTKSISVSYTSSNDLEVFADVNMLRTVLRNLISNAIKFTNTGGHINVKSILKNNHVEISISDNGIGMNEEKHKFLFEIISNTTTLGTANENGSGLGLVLCKEFVNKNGGTIWAESEEGKGSCFKFTLPLNQ